MSCVRVRTKKSRRCEHNHNDNDCKLRDKLSVSLKSNMVADIHDTDAHERSKRDPNRVSASIVRIQQQRVVNIFSNINEHWNRIVSDVAWRGVVEAFIM